jgi:hypothetical protein
VHKLYLTFRSVLIIPQPPLHRSLSSHPLVTKRTRQIAKSSAAPRANNQHARPPETKSLAFAKVERVKLTARRDVCFVCHVPFLSTQLLNISDSNDFTGAPDSSALQEASRFFQKGGPNVEEL